MVMKLINVKNDQKVSTIAILQPEPSETTDLPEQEEVEETTETEA